jgi:hypothetical protein
VLHRCRARCWWQSVALSQLDLDEWDASRHTGVALLLLEAEEIARHCIGVVGLSAADGIAEPLACVLALQHAPSIVGKMTAAAANAGAAMASAGQRAPMLIRLCDHLIDWRTMLGHVAD